MPLAKKFITDVEEVLMQSFKKETVIKELSKSIAEGLYKQFEKEFDGLKQEITDIKQEFEEFKKQAVEEKANMEKKLNRLEQYSRGKNLTIFGIKEEKEENIEKVILEIFNSKLGTKLTEQDVDRCRRVGKHNRDKPRPVLVNFVNYRMKISIYQLKKKLKGTRIIIKEDLTRENVKTYKEASEKYGYRNTWTKNGVIWVKTAEKSTIYSMELNDEPLEEITDEN